MGWAVKVEGLRKVYCHYARPLDRLKELAFFGVRRFHDELVALDDVSFEVEAGSTVGIIGRNGAGKSTLLKIISGNLGQTAGKVQVQGRISSILELGIGFQPGLTGKQNIRINALLLGMRPDEIEACIPEVTEFSELGAAIDRPIATYSSGMQARLAFSILTAVKADVVVLDEALAAGDAGFVAKSNKLIHQFVASGSTVLVVSHDMRIIRDVCDRAIWIERGVIQADGDAESVVKRYLHALPELAALYERREIDERTSIPTRLPYRFRTVDPAAPRASYPIQGLEVVERETGKVLGHARPQVESHFDEFVRGARLLGLNAEEARQGWGEVQDFDGTPVRLFELAGGETLILAPISPQEGVGPVDLRVTFRDTQTQPLQMDLLRAGEWQGLGTLFGQGDGALRSVVFPFPDACRFDTLVPPLELVQPETAEVVA